MLELVYLIVVVAIAALVFWDRMRHEPPGAPRWLWLAAVLALSGAMATTGADVSGPLTAAAWLVALGLGAAAARAREHADRRG